VSDIIGIFMKSKTMEEDIKTIAEDLRGELDKLNNKTLLITGGSGFIGRYIVLMIDFMNKNTLENPCRVISVDNLITGAKEFVPESPHIKMINHDVRFPLKIEEPIDFIVHAAGIASPFYYTKYPLETIEVGTLGTKNMLDLAKIKNVESFIFFSSSEVYGDPDPRFVPTPETYFGNVNCIGPRACYDESKRLGETLCMTYFRLFNLPVKIVRPFNVYGPGIKKDDYRALPNFIYNALKGNPLLVYGTGDHTRAFCYMNDAVTAFFKVLLSDYNGEVFNVGNSNEEISILDLANLIAEIFDHKIKIKRISAPIEAYASADPKRRCPDTTKIKGMFGHEPKVDLRTGLCRTIQWFKEEYNL